METYNPQQQSVILKGIAQQILSMKNPTFSNVDLIFNEFGRHLISHIEFEFPLEVVDFDGFSYSAKLHPTYRDNIILRLASGTTKTLHIADNSIKYIR